MKRLVVFIISMMLASVSNAARITDLQVTAGQVRNIDMVSAGMWVTGTNEASGTLTVGAGFEIECPNSLANKAGGKISQSFFLPGNTLTVVAPFIAPGSYTITGWSEWPNGETKSCALHYRGEAIDSGVSVGVLGTGWTFGANTYATVNTRFFTMTKPSNTDDPGGYCEAF